MISVKNKSRYRTPLTSVTEIDLEGLVCLSAYKAVQVDQLHNINADTHDDPDDYEPFYFGS